LVELTESCAAEHDDSWGCRGIRKNEVSDFPGVVDLKAENFSTKRKRVLAADNRSLAALRAWRTKKVALSNVSKSMEPQNS
jgi:hypothetical protein